MRIALKPGFKLMTTQVETLRRICVEPRFWDFSEMGAGKTWPQCVLAKGAIDDGLVDSVVIVTPKAVLGDWYAVFRDVMDNVNIHEDVLLYHGVPTKYRSYVKLRPIIITTYEVLAADFERFETMFSTQRCMLVLDEAHRVRTPGTRQMHPRTGAVKYEGSRRTAMCTILAHRASRCYLLTGTPIVNGLRNAFAYAHMTFPGIYYNSYEHFKLQHLEYRDKKLIRYKNVKKLEDIIAAHSIRYLKREIMDLPPVTYMTRELDWQPAQKQMYKKMMKDFVIETDTRFIEAETVGARLVRLHQIITNPQQLGLDAESTRFQVLDDDLESIGCIPGPDAPEPKKVVIFAHYRHTIDRLKKKYQEAGFNPAVIYGGTTDVEEQKRKFNEDPTCLLMIAHPISAGIGINLTVSSFVIFFEYSYDLDGYDQAVARVDRPGQKRAVTVINYGIRGSMELKRILPALISKKKLSMALLRDPAEFMKFIDLEEDDLWEAVAA